MRTFLFICIECTTFLELFNFFQSRFFYCIQFGKKQHILKFFIQKKYTMTTLADISAAMSEMEKRTQPLFAARALPPTSTSLPSAAGAAAAKSSSSSPSLIPHSSSTAASRKTFGNAVSTTNMEQQSVQRRRTSVRSQGANRANYRLMSNNVMTGHPISSAHANVSSYGDTDSYENDELQKL